MHFARRKLYRYLRAMSELGSSCATVDARRTGETVIYWTGGVRTGVRKGEPEYRNLVQGHEENAQFGTIRSMVQ